MPVLPYCVFASTLALPEIVTGVQQSAVHRLDAAGLSALYSEVENISKDPGELAQAAMSFQSTVQQVFGAGIVIPFRFPTLLESVEELRAHISSQAERYTLGLTRLQGMAQMEVRLTRLSSATTSASGTPSTGTEYLKARQAESNSMNESIAALEEAAGPLVHEWKTREAAGATRCYALIPHDKAPEFKNHLGFVRLGGGTRAVISGPWPPSEFLPEQS